MKIVTISIIIHSRNIKWGNFAIINLIFQHQQQFANASIVLIDQHLCRLMGKPTICIGENKGADQLRGHREADQHLSFRYSDSTVPLLLKSEISSF